MLSNVPSFSLGQNNGTFGQVARYIYILIDLLLVL
jgi:hypothetical protein